MQTKLVLDEKIKRELREYLAQQHPEPRPEVINAIAEAFGYMLELLTDTEAAVQNLPVGIATTPIPCGRGVVDNTNAISSLSERVTTLTGQVTQVSDQVGEVSAVAQQASENANAARAVADAASDSIAKICCSDLMSNHG